MQPRHLQTIVQILDRGLKSNSYKFALLRALADAGQNLKTNIIGFDWLGERFIEYYWSVSVNSRVRQATDPTRDPVIMRFIRQEVADLKLTSTTHPADYKNKYRSRYENMLSKCCSRGGCCPPALLSKACRDQIERGPAPRAAATFAV